jgi:hypothetical protein
VPTIDLKAEAEKLGVEIDENDPRGSMERVFAALAKERDDAVEAKGSADERSEKLMTQMESVLNGIQAKAHNESPSRCACRTPG